MYIIHYTCTYIHVEAIYRYMYFDHYTQHLVGCSNWVRDPALLPDLLYTQSLVYSISSALTPL